MTRFERLIGAAGLAAAALTASAMAPNPAAQVACYDCGVVIYEPPLPGVHEKCFDVDLPEWWGATDCVIRYEDGQEFCTLGNIPCHGEEPASLDIAGVSAPRSNTTGTRNVATGYDQRVDCKGFVIERKYSGDKAAEARRAVEVLTL